MTLPFVRQLPNGQRVLTEFDCKDDEVELLGKKFIALDGAYLIEILPDATVRIAACQFIHGKQADVEVMICGNGPELIEAVHDLVRASQKHLASAKVVPLRQKPKLKIVLPNGGDVA